MKHLYKFLLGISLVSVFLLVYSPHFSYKYPLHVDEWQHLARGIHILENKQISFINPYFIPNPLVPEENYYPNFEIGFHLFLAIFFYITHLNPILFYRFFPAIFAVLSAFLLFNLIYYLTRKFYIALFSILFFAALKININISGLWFFTPLTFALPFLFLFLFLFFKSLDSQDNKFLILSILIFLILFIIHPISVILIYFIILLFLFINFNKMYFRCSIPFILSPLLLAFIFILFIWKEAILNLKFLITDWLILEEGWGYVELKYFLPSFYNIIPFSLAIIGIYPSIKNSKLRLFVIWFLLTSFLIFIFHNFKFSILIPYQRILYYSFLSLVPLSAIGLYFILNKIKKYKFIIFILFTLVFYFTFYNYYNLPPESQLYHVIEDKDYDALEFLSNYNNKIIMSPLKMSVAIYPITKNYVIAMTKGNLPDREIQIVKDFYSTDCNKKKEIIDIYNIDFIISENKLNCNFLKEIYSKGDYIYEA